MHCLHIISNLNSGGAERVLYNICCHDKCNTHTVVSMSNSGFYGSKLEEINIKVFCLNIKSLKDLFIGFIRLRKIIKLHKADVIQTWMYHADLLGGITAYLSGERNVFWNIRHASLSASTTKPMTIIVAKCCAKLSKIIPHKIICCSSEAAKYHIHFGYQKNKIQIISNGYDTANFTPNSELISSFRQKIGVESNVPLIGMVARFSPEKDHDNILRSLQILKKSNKSFFCIFIGMDMDVNNKKLTSWLQSYKLENHTLLLGVQHNIPDFLNVLDLHILSSRSEAFPNVIAEAMACGTPCVSTKVGESEYIIGDTGWVVAPQDPTSLAKKISDALNEMSDVELWNHRRNNARSRIVNNFSVKKMVLSYNSHWKGDF
jgi:glycosyltransferase involved in cell wall biosynthesis